MLSSIKSIQERLLSSVTTNYYRYLYYQFTINSRLTGLLGSRGVGKTTLLIQFLKNNPEILKQAIYCSADHIYFSKVSLYEFIEEMYLTEGTTYFFIDEIHKYHNWSQEIKNIYDGFPDIKIIFSGSSSLDLVRGGYDLSRRATLMYLVGMSFREYMNLTKGLNIKKISYQELLSHQHSLHTAIANVPRIKGLFKDYLENGYYPFSLEDPNGFAQKLLRVAEKTIYEDIANFYKLKTSNLQVFKKILVFLASIPPGSVSAHNIAKNLSVNDHTVVNYLKILQETNLINIVYTYDGGNVGMCKAEKVFLNNTNLQYALQHTFGKEVEIGTIRELMFLQSIRGAGIEAYYSKVGDYRINGSIFEIGGKNKTRKQIKSQKKSFLVKDELSAVGDNVIPLIYFGFLY